MLADSLLSVARKLEGLLESRICRFVREVGFSLVCRASLVACGWGNISAKGWSCDVDFARFLAIMKYNNGGMRGGALI
jgi:hypothetical protein